MLFRSGGFKDGLGLLSPGAVYQFQRTRKVVPFVAGGYSLAFRSGHLNLGYFGGGINYWPKDHYGLLFEVRDHLSSTNIRDNLLLFRIGFLFR